MFVAPKVFLFVCFFVCLWAPQQSPQYPWLHSDNTCKGLWHRRGRVSVILLGSCLIFQGCSICVFYVSCAYMCQLQIGIQLNTTHPMETPPTQHLVVIISSQGNWRGVYADCVYQPEPKTQLDRCHVRVKQGMSKNTYNFSKLSCDLATMASQNFWLRIILILYLFKHFLLK